MKDTKSAQKIIIKANGISKPGKREEPAGGSLKIYSFIALFSILCSLAITKTITIGSILGGILISYLLLLVFYRDLVRYKPRFLKDDRKMLLLGLLMAGTLIFARASEYVLTGISRGFDLPSGSIIYAIPIASGAMLAMLLFESHTAIMFSFVISLLSGLWLRDPAYAIYAFMGNLTAAFAVIRCKKRTEILKAGFYLFAANVLTVVTVLLFKGELISAKGAYSVFFSMASAVWVIAVVSIILPVLEYIFNITTDISLLELLDLEHPIMKTMMVAAPGTYHHSIIVGNLVESAAEAIGVNPLLARVSAYYHDIGKIKMPEYFIENQSSGVSKHERLTPHMSSMVLISHVKEGVDLGREYKLPETVLDIIRQHHGTSLITYFYQKAREKTEDLPEDEYKYPGPKPQTKVAALVMMADAVEAASRVLSEPTPARISSLVNKIINHVFLEGQLDDCELTLKDIQLIKKHFTYILTGILHKRIDYPGFDFREAPDGGPRIEEPRPLEAAKREPDREGRREAPATAWTPRG
jgi:putative nucleotidyltransferase with HDIG domain